MSAAFNGSVNVSINDGWIPEFARHGQNCFVTPTADHHALSIQEIDDFDHENIMDVLENEVIPAYYNDPERWVKIMQQSMQGCIRSSTVTGWHRSILTACIFLLITR